MNMSGRKGPPHGPDGLPIGAGSGVKSNSKPSLPGQKGPNDHSSSFADLVDWSKNESESHPHAIPNDPVSAGAGPGSVTGGATNTSSARKNTDMENLEKEDSFDQSRVGLNPMLQSAFGGPGAAGGPAGNIANQIAAAAQNLSQTAHALGGAVDQQGVPNPKAQSVPNTPGTEMLTPATQQAMAR